MALSYKLVSRITQDTEDALRSLDNILIAESYLPRTQWGHRDVFTSRQFNSREQQGITRGHASIAMGHKKFVKIKGVLKSGEHISAVVVFDGFTHETEESDYSNPIEPAKILLTVTAKEYVLLKKMYRSTYCWSGGSEWSSI